MKTNFSKLITIVIIIAAIFTAGCDNSYRSNNRGTNVTVEKSGDVNFPLNDFANIVRKAHNPSEIEEMINAPNGINYTGNYIHVREGKENGKEVIYCYFQNENGTTEDIARAEIEKQGYNTVINTYGSQAYYTNYHPNPLYISTISFVLGAYLFSPHYNYYRSSYSYGHYPTTYVKRTKVIEKTSIFRKTSPSAPKANSYTDTNNSTRKNYNYKAQNQSEKSMEVRDYNKEIKTGGFSSNNKKPNVYSPFSSNESANKTNSYSKPSKFSTFGSSSTSSYKSSFGSSYKMKSRPTRSRSSRR